MSRGMGQFVYEISRTKVKGFRRTVQKFSSTFFKMVVGDAQLPRCRGNALTRTPQSPEPPRLPKEFLFLLLFLLDKGEKEGRNELNYKKAVAFSPFLKLMRQPDSVFQSYRSSNTRLLFFSLLGRIPSSTTFTSGVKPILDFTRSATFFAISAKSTDPFVST